MLTSGNMGIQPTECISLEKHKANSQAAYLITFTPFCRGQAPNLSECPVQGQSGTIFAVTLADRLQRRLDLGKGKRRKYIEETYVMDEAAFASKLKELLSQFGEAPDRQEKRLAQLAREAQANQKKLQKSIDSLQESLDYLRVCIKYHIFDLEATRRENEYLRKLLEQERDN